MTQLVQLQKDIKELEAANIQVVGISYDSVDVLAKFTKKHKISIKQFPRPVLAALGKAADEVVREMASKDPLSKKIFGSYHNFRKRAVGWAKVSEESFSLARG